MAFKIQLLSDVAGFIRGTDDVTKALDDVADSLDDLARDTKQNADKAADSLEREFSDAMREVRKETKDTSRKMGDDLKHGTKEAGEGFDDLKDEARDSAKEAAASFSGEFDDVADYVQEVLAQALSGFGPIGAAAGLAAAAGIGFLVSSLQDAAEKAEEAQEDVKGLAAELYDVKGNPAAIDYLTRMQELVGSIVDNKEWYEFWQPKNITWIEQQDKLWANSNITLEERAQLLRAQAGDVNSTQRALATLNAEIEREQSLGRTWVDQYGVLHTESTQREKDLLAQRDAVAQNNSKMAEAQRQADAVAQAEQRASDSAQQFTEALKDNASVLDDHADKILKGGKINFAEWAKQQKAAAKQNKIILEFDAEAKLSAEARENFRSLPTETQSMIAAEYAKGGKKKRLQIETMLENEVEVKNKDVKVEPVEANVKVTAKPDVDMSAARANAQAQADQMNITIKSTVAPPTLPAIAAPEPVVYHTRLDSTALPGDVNNARAKAQTAASSKKIEYKTKLNSSGLQAEVNRAAAAIRPPVIYARVKAKKEVE